MKKTHKFVGLIPPNLLRMIRDRQCILFAGAGLSAQSTTDEGKHLPTWAALLRGMVDWCMENSVDLRADKAELLSIVERGRYMPVAQELQERLGPRLNTCVRDVLHCGRVRPSEAHSLVVATNAL